MSVQYSGPGRSLDMPLRGLGHGQWPIREALFSKLMLLWVCSAKWQPGVNQGLAPIHIQNWQGPFLPISSTLFGSPRPPFLFLQLEIWGCFCSCGHHHFSSQGEIKREKKNNRNFLHPLQGPNFLVHLSRKMGLSQRFLMLMLLGQLCDWLGAGW